MSHGHIFDAKQLHISTWSSTVCLVSYKHILGCHTESWISSCSSMFFFVVSVFTVLLNIQLLKSVLLLIDPDSSMNECVDLREADRDFHFCENERKTGRWHIGSTPCLSSVSCLTTHQQYQVWFNANLTSGFTVKITLYLDRVLIVVKIIHVLKSIVCFVSFAKTHPIKRSA